MARYETTIEVLMQPQAAFELLSDFSRTTEWDPSVVSAVKHGDQPVGLGSIFTLTVKFFGRENVIDYEITEYQPNSRVVLRGENAGVVAIDQILIKQNGEKTAVTYSADLQFNGFAKLIDPVMGRVFKRIGDRARDGMIERLNR